MVIEKISISSFGSLNDTEIELSDSINVIEGKNESGKTTIMNFVAFVLYGSDTELNKRIRSTNAPFSGKITAFFEGHGKVIISRTASASGQRSGDSVSVVSCDSLKEINVGKLSPGEYFLGINRDFFESSAFIRQSGASDYNAETASSAVQNMLNSANEKMNTDKAKKKLDETRKLLKYKNRKGGVIHTISSELSLLEAELDSNRNSGKLSEDIERQISELQEKKRELEAVPMLIEQEKTARRAKKYRELQSKHSELLKEISEKENQATKTSQLNAEYRNSEIMTRIRSLDVEAKMIRSKCDVLEEALSTAEALQSTMNGEDLKIPKDTNEYLSFIKASRADIKKLFHIAVSTFILTALTVIAGAVAIAFSEIIASLAFFFTALCALTAGFIFLSYRKNKLQSMQIKLSEFGFGLHEPLRDISDEFERRASYENAKQSRQSEIEKSKAQIVDQYNLYDEKIRLLTQELQKASPQSEGLSLDERIIFTEEKILESFKLESALNSEISALRSQESSLSDEISAYKLYSDEKSLPSPQLEGYSERDLDEYLNTLMNKQKEISASIHQLEIKHSSLMARMRPDNEILSEIAEKRALLTKREEQFEIVELAQNALEAAAGNIRSAVTPNVIKLCNSLFAEITGGRYSVVGVDGDSLSLNGVSGDEMKKENELSYGTNEAMYLAFRLSLCAVLCRDEMPPVMMDETFAHIDDARSLAIMKTLRDMGSQSIIFSCSRRESELALANGYDVNVIKI